MKSKCCGAEVTTNKPSKTIRYYTCNACYQHCDLAPALRDSKDILEFVEKEIEELNKYSLTYTRKCLLIQANKIKNFIEGKE